MREHQAFPRPAFVPPGSLQEPGEVMYYHDTGCRGMTLREYFAGQALVGLLKGAVALDKEHVIAELAYRMADAMIERGEKPC